MKRYCLLLSVMLLCFLCACSVTEQNERTTMYDIMESGTEEEIAAAAKDAQEKHDDLEEEFDYDAEELSMEDGVHHICYRHLVH